MAGVGSDGGIRPGGGSPLPPLTPKGTPVADKVKEVPFPETTPPGGSSSLAGRVTKGPVRTSSTALLNMETMSRESLLPLYKAGNILAGYELMNRSRQRALYEGVKDYKWVDEHNEAGNFALNKAEAVADPVHQGILALRYLIGLGTEPSEEKFLRVVKGLNPDSGRPVKGMKDISKDSLISYEYFRFLRNFQGADLLLADPPDPKTLLMVEALETAAKGGHPRAEEIWNGPQGEELRSLREEVSRKLGR